jgi:hypothetical protein
VGVDRAPARKENFTLVDLAVAVIILEEVDVGGPERDHAAAVAEQSRCDVQPFGEDRGAVHHAVAVCVLEDFDPDAAGTVVLVVGIVETLGDPESAEVIPRLTDRLGDLGLRGIPLGREPTLDL